MSEVIAECAPDAVPAILSGPSFARDVARGMPTAVTLAASDGKLAAELAQAVSSATLRPYHSSDVRGVEIGGAAKNVLAIAAGIVSGRGLGYSATAALTTRGFAELVRFGRACGGKTGNHDGALRARRSDPDLHQSAVAQFHLRRSISARARKPDDIHRTTGLAEGTFTAPVLLEMARDRSVDMPISSAVAAVIAEKMSVDAAIESLLTRPLKAEE